MRAGGKLNGTVMATCVEALNLSAPRRLTFLLLFGRSAAAVKKKSKGKKRLLKKIITPSLQESKKGDLLHVLIDATCMEALESSNQETLTPSLQTKILEGRGLIVRRIVVFPHNFKRTINQNHN